ncbi:MAG: hypothetical protein WKF84_29060 [Pyrinomonadaceae bacterium]
MEFGPELKATGSRTKGVIWNGPERMEFTAGSFDGSRLRLRIDYYDGELSAQFDASAGGTLNWRATRGRRGRASRAFRSAPSTNFPIARACSHICCEA